MCSVVIALQRLRPLAAWGLAALIGAAGCSGPKGLDVHPVAGSVTFDGQPIEEGWITFRGTSGDVRAFAGRIQRGQYATKTFAGPMRVEITASRPIPGKFVSGGPGGPEMPALEHFIPARYNQASTLEAQIPMGGTSQLDFRLTSAAN